MEALVHELREARNTAELGEAVFSEVRRSLGCSGFNLVRPSGPVLGDADLFTVNEVLSGPAARAKAIEGFHLVDVDLAPFEAAYAMPERCFDIADRHPEAHRTTMFHEFWRPQRIERQIVALLGTAAEPGGFFCAARSARERPFTARDLAGVEAIRQVVDRELSASSRTGGGPLGETLGALARHSRESWLVFSAEGHLLWLTDAAQERLAAPTSRVCRALALGRSEGLELLRAWVRGEARRGRPGQPAPPPAALLQRFGEPTLRSYLDSGRRVFLVGLPPPDPRDPERVARRAFELAERHRLTPRQAEVLALLAQGRTNRTIAAALGCRESTVEFHVTAILARLHCRNRAAAVARFWE